MSPYELLNIPEPVSPISTKLQPLQERNQNAPPTKTTRQRTYKSLGEILVDLAEQFRPPEHLTVSKASEQYIYLNNPGAYVGPWLNSTTWYMVEPMNEFTSRRHRGLIFVGPAQCAKTQALILNTVAYRIKVDPMDTLLFCPTQSAARDFSIRRIDRMHNHSEEIGALLGATKDADNKFDKHYTNGMLLSLSWPSVTELAGRPVGCVVFTDYDRMPDDIGGDGAPYWLGSKRTTTFGTAAMTLAESSPSRPIKDPHWIRRTPHEAPPCDGILGLYNHGDRRRWHWPCPDCGSYFEGTFEMLMWDDKASHADSADTVRLQCPHCSYKIHPDQRDEMSMFGIWLKDGMWIDENGLVQGDEPRASIASFWLNGIAAAFVKWPALVEMYLNAKAEFDRTQSEEALKKFYNNDLGVPYMPVSDGGELLPENLKARAEPFAEKLVPVGTRFLLGTVDVQKNGFVCQVFGVQAGAPFDLVLIDRFTIKKSDRVDEVGDPYMVRPGTFLEDWDLLVKHLMSKTYELDDGSGRRMMLKMTVCDSGGEAGVTTQAYNFVRRLRYDKEHPEFREFSGRFHLVKGDHTLGVPRARITFPDSNRKDRFAAARGDVPVLMLNSNELKDALRNRLECTEPGKGMMRFPNWLADWFWAEMCEETRDSKGWHNPNSRRNEAWDLCYYAIGACVSPLLRIDYLDWNEPPGWAADWDKNSLVSAPDEGRRFERSQDVGYDFAQFAKALA